MRNYLALLVFVLGLGAMAFGGINLVRYELRMWATCPTCGTTASKSIR